MEISEWTWKSFDGLDMYACAWTPQGLPKAVILLVHGLGEHVGRYDHVAAALTEKGYAMLGFDLRGHGKSGGPRGHTPSSEAFMRDIDSMVKQAKVRYPGIRQFMYGLSMGGNLVLNYILDRQPALAGAVVSAPGLRSPILDQKNKAIFAKVLGVLLPSFTIPSGLDANMLSRVPEVVDRYKQDPLVHDRVSLGLAKSQLEMVPWIFKHAGDLNIPLLVMHGTEDKIVYIQGSREFARKAGDKVTLKIWDGMYHEIHNEPEQEQVLAYMLDWLGKH
ncbi:MAG: lysophospholipase [Anaerolineales bacterium]|jgi:alpha-beta hydrolase superfamily lysophospholipase